jgi:protoporphyrin/coproporphyrin ferrochelatase
MNAAAAAAAAPRALVALNMGGPDSLDAVRPFLRNLLADPYIVRLPPPLSLVQGLFAEAISRLRARKVRESYARLGGATPLLRHSVAQAAKIAAAATSRGAPHAPFVAMRYWAPSADAACAVVADGMRRGVYSGVTALSLYPQFSTATSESSFVDFRAAAKRAGIAASAIVEIDRYPTLKGYLDATAASIKRALPADQSPPFVLFSAHGLPQSYVARGDPYRDEIEATYRGVLERLPPSLDVGLSFQSRVGPAKWLEPSTEDAVRAAAARGVRSLLMVPLAFVSDHVETLDEMDVLYGDLARSLGMAFARVPALNDDDVFCDALGALAAERAR